MVSDKELSYAEKQAIGKCFVITLVQALLEDNSSAFYYIAVKGNMLEDFKSASEKRKEFDLADFGSILLSGYGEPSAEVMEFMEKEFGFKHSEAPKMRLTKDGLKEE